MSSAPLSAAPEGETGKKILVDIVVKTVLKTILNRKSLVDIIVETVLSQKT